MAGKKQRTRRYEVTSTRYYRIQVDASNEDEATEMALAIPEREWTDTGGDIEVECLDDDDDDEE